MVVGDLTVFEQTASRLKLRLPRWTVSSVYPALSRKGGVNEVSPGCAHPGIVLIDLAHPWHFKPGKPSDRAGSASLDYLDAAITLARRGVVDALVTAPVTKWAIERSGKPFVGQTEYLAAAMGASSVVMMFVSPALRIALLTRHLALRQVALRVTKPLIRRTILVTVKGLQRQFGIHQPRLAVCGLNPHAGEDGLFGDEERRILLPVLRELRRDGIRLDGPFAADGFFANARRPAPHQSLRDRQARRPAHRRVEPPPNGAQYQRFGAGYDAVVCWYHDQGLIPFKLMSRDRGCQLSLGLPIVRTSPDHGSALDIAGRGVANPGSMRYALQLAVRLATRRSSLVK